MNLGKFRKPATAVVGIGVSALVLSGIAGLPAQADTGGHRAAAPHAADPRQASSTQHDGFYDARELPAKAAAAAEASRVQGESRGDTTYVSSLGRQAVLDFDPLTGTPRDVGRLDGFLTARSSAPAKQIALGYVRDHAAALGLTNADLSTFDFRQDYVDPSGLHNLSWTQSVQGTPVFGNGLKVKVTRDGRVLSVQGSPVSGLAQLAAKASAGGAMSAGQARDRSATDVGARADSVAVNASRAGATTWKNNDFAKLVWFLTPSGLRAGWSTYVNAGGSAYQHVIDAASGKVLFRRSTVDSEGTTAEGVPNQQTLPTVLKPKHHKPRHHKPKHHKPKSHKGDAKVYQYYPGAAIGGKPVVVNFFDKGWLKRSAKFLKGSSVIAWSDVNDDNQINPGEKTAVPGTKHVAQFSLKPFKSSATKLCSAKHLCTWDPTKPGSWKTNRRADVTNAFYLANRYHDWLQNGPIKFTTKAGNFTSSGGDPVLLNALDGASTAGGLPDGNHIDNANMDTPPDGTPPTMQMYLWHAPGATDAEDGYVATSGAFDPSVLFHEYTHGLSNRLVVDADGTSTLNDLQAGAMGEAWSDYYAMDYLVRQGYVKDTKASGEVFEGTYLTAGAPFRTMAIDCAVGSKTKGCSTALDGTPGGYTYGDVPTIGGGPEVHSSGEVWSQALWDIRKAVGSTKADELITRAMPLSADDPSMLDMRNAIIQADLVSFGGNDTHKLWQIFANRGMGYFAGSINSGDTAPAEDFKVPPSPATARTSISGIVTDPTTGAPVEGATVLVAGFGDQFEDVTAADGSYTISGLYAGTYKKVVALAPGYFPEAQQVNSRSNDAADFSITRDWASASGGGKVTDFNGPDFAPQCGPGGAIDLSQSTGWGSTTGDDAGTPTNVFVPKHITVQLPTAIDISTIGVDPTATCGDGASASTAGYTIETSPDGTTWTPAASGTFTAADNGVINKITPTAGADGVQYVRFTMLSNQTPDFATNCPGGAYSGCSFTDMSELAVFGSESP